MSTEWVGFIRYTPDTHQFPNCWLYPNYCKNSISRKLHFFIQNFVNFILIWFSYFLLFLEEPAAEEVEDLDSLKNVDPDAETTLLFTKPTQVAGGSVELPAGKIVEFLVGFANKGLKDFVIDSIDASFRYPMDFTYHIQNFSAIAYQKTVKEGQEATVAYSFIPADAFAGRPIGLSINLAYR